MIIVAGKIFVKPSGRAKFIRLSSEAVGLARKNRDCLDFAVSPDPIDKGRVNVFERWKSEKALKKFRQSGPDDDLGSLVVSFDVQQYEVTDANP